MKKLLLSALLTSVVALGAASCTPPAATDPNASPNPGSSSTPATGADGHFSNKAAVLAYMNCIKLKVPQAAPVIDAQINVLNGISEAQFAASVDTYKALLQAYAAFGC